MSSSTLTIEELSSNGLSAARVVRLKGSSLPLMGAAWKGQNQVVTTWYPGNGDEATQQNLGPRDMPSTWNGDWRRTMFGTNDSGADLTTEDGSESRCVRPDILANFLEEMFREGRRLRVTWAVVSADLIPKSNSVEGKIVREGRAKDWEFKYHRLEDIEWTITFDWMGRGINTTRVTSTRDDSVARGASTGLQSAIQRLKSINDLAHLKGNLAGPLTLGQLESLANTPSLLATSIARQLEQITTSVNQLGDIAKTLKTQPIAIANHAVDLATNTINLVNNFRDEMSRTPPELLSTRLKVDSYLRAKRHFDDTDTTVAVVARAADVLAKSIRPASQAQALAAESSRRTAALPGDILTSYRTKTGDTPQKLSQKFYKNPDRGADICIANRLSWYTAIFDPGTLLVIPVLSITKSGV